MPWLTTDYIFLAWAGTVFGAFESWEFLVARSTGGNRLLFLTDSSMALGSILVLLLAVLVAAWRVARVWREESPPALVMWVWRKLSTPVLGQALLHRWMRWELNRNPIGWLELRTWRGRLVMWSWFAIVISLYSSLLANLHLYQHIFHGIQSLLAWLLVGTIGLSAAGSFRRERESGALELLLVAPLREWQVIGGRLRGLWTQFLPSAGLLLALWRYCSKFLSDQDELASMVFFAGTFITLPVVGLYFSLARTNFISAFTWTLFVGVAVPSTLGGNLGFLHPLFWHWQVLAGAAGTSQENFAPTFSAGGDRGSDGPAPPQEPQVPLLRPRERVPAMTLPPVVDRELRVAARNATTFWLRTGVALMAMLVHTAVLLISSLGVFGSSPPGDTLFSVVTWMSLIAALSAGVFFTSDCLSSERRDGTLGFLFLTNLRGYDVVAGSSFPPRSAALMA